MILKHKDRELLRFEWIEPQGVHVISVNESERKFLPLEMKGGQTTMPSGPGFPTVRCLSIATTSSECLATLGSCASKRRPCMIYPGGISAAAKARLAKLKGFRFKRHKYYNLPVDRLRRIEDFLQKRIAEILEFGAKADEFLEITGKRDSVNHVNNGSCALQIKENLKADPFITYAELADLLQISQSSIARNMKSLQESGEIRRVGADKNGHWEVINLTYRDGG